MKEYTRFEYTRALNNAHEDPEAYKIIETLIGEHLSMLQHMKKTSLWDVFQYEERLTKTTTEPMEMLMWDNEKLKKEVNKLRRQLGMGEKYKERVKEE